MIPLLAVTVGDMNGIGPEVALKGVRKFRGRALPFLLGPAPVFEFYARRCRLPARFAVAANGDSLRNFVRTSWKSRRIPILDLPFDDPGTRVEPGELALAAGKTAGMAITRAVDLALGGEADALVTAPLSKAALHKAGYRWPGQTEMIQHLSRGEHVAMMLVSRTLRVGLVTIHLPLREVAARITPALLRERIITIHNALRSDWRIPKPHLAVLGLNPHAGEHRELGEEEEQCIIPVLNDLRQEGIHLQGPFPADGFFARFRPHVYDAVIAMYHDQGLVPLKLLARGKGVNVSVGLPIVRTSPDHGTAFDLAGKNKADPSSMVEALHLAEAIVMNRKRGIR
ncbi:MAG TPA: 4-hydroxythreonine-4-phosphate dehydrogenase PdxA [Bacteroidota bacterium]|nr:4-hydroxythreonine-4-phosphate dehydrogenase PdxA [Bacteroidota bacterium]